MEQLLEDHSDDHPLAQHNHLIRAKMHFSTLEGKIFTLMLKGIKKGDTVAKNIEIRVTDIIGENPSGKLYTLLREACVDLYEKSLDIPKVGVKPSQIKKKDFHEVRLVQELELDTGSGYVRGLFTDRVQSYLIDLKNQFALGEFEHLITLKTGYSHRFYWLMKSYESKGGATITVDELKKIVGAIEIKKDKDTKEVIETKDKYPRYYDFKRFVLEPSMDEINKFITVHHKPNKSGRTVESITFTIPQSTPVYGSQQKIDFSKPYTPNGTAKYKPHPNLRMEPAAEPVSADQAERTKLMMMMKDRGLTPDQAEYYLNKLSFDGIRSQCMFVSNASNGIQPRKRKEVLISLLDEMIKEAV